MTRESGVRSPPGPSARCHALALLAGPRAHEALRMGPSVPHMCGNLCRAQGHAHEKRGRDEAVDDPVTILQLIMRPGCLAKVTQESRVQGPSGASAPCHITLVCSCKSNGCNNIKAKGKIVILAKSISLSCQWKLRWDYHGISIFYFSHINNETIGSVQVWFNGWFTCVIFVSFARG